MKKILLPSLLISMAFFLFSCGGETKEQEVMSEIVNDDTANVEEVVVMSNENSSFVGKNFGLVMEGAPWASYVEAIEEPPFFTIYSAEDGSLGLSGSAGCNNIIGTATINEEEETITFLAGSTMMACSEERMQLEYNFLNALTEAQAYAWNNNILILMDNSGNTLATFMPY